MSENVLRCLGILLLSLLPLSTLASERGFTNVQGGAISDEAPVTGREPGEVVVLVSFPQTAVSADLILTPDRSNDVSEVSVDLGGWLCFRQKITLELLSSIVEQTRTEVVGSFIARAGASEPAIIKEAQNAAFRALTDVVESERVARGQVTGLDWAAGEDFTARYANCYTAIEIQRLQTAMLPAIQGRIARSLAPSQNHPDFSDPFNPRTTNNDDDDPIELGDRELIQ